MKSAEEIMNILEAYDLTAPNKSSNLRTLCERRGIQ